MIWKKNHHFLIYLFSAFCFSLFLSLLPLASSSCSALNFTRYHSYYDYSTDLGSTWQWELGGGFQSSVWGTNVSPNGSFIVRTMSMTVELQPYYTDWQYLSITGSVDLTSWQFSTSMFYYNICNSGDILFLHFYDGAYDLLTVDSVTTITSCSVQNDHLYLGFESYVERPQASTLGFIEVEIFNHFQPQVPNTGGLIVCGGNLGVPCTSNWPITGNYFGWNGLSIDIEEITDPSIAIMRKQLAIQQQEQQHRQQLEDDAGQIIDGTDEDGNSLSEPAIQYTTNVLQALISFRDTINTVHATDCIIDFPRTGNLTPMGGTFNLGTINFCSLSVPTPIMSLATIGISWLMIKLSLWLVRQFYETFEEVLDGGGGK